MMNARACLLLLLAAQQLAGAARESGCSFVPATDYGGEANIVGRTTAATPERCCADCLAMPSCAAGILLGQAHGTLQGCWLKNTNVGGYPKTNATACKTARAPSPPIAQGNLTRLTDPKARCMDGTLSGYYYLPSSNASFTNSWIIELQGGGECASKDQCASRPESSLGSSKFFKPSVSFGYLLSGDAATNPHFSQWNRVFIPYCSQDLWTGQRTEASDDTFGWYFSGHLVLEAVLEALEATHNGLAHASEVVLTGESAGGIGVWPNLDWLGERYPRARVTGAPIAGMYFFAHPYTGPGHTHSDLADFRKAAWPSHYNLWDSFVDGDCARALPATPWACVLSNYSYPYVVSPKFVIESGVDKVVTLAHDWVPKTEPWPQAILDYFTEWHANMTVALSPLMRPTSKDGVFNPACWIHTEFSATSPIIRGSNYLQAFTKWYTTGAAVKLQDECGILCNPTCAHG